MTSEFGGSFRIKDVDERAWKALQNMLGHPWFQRVWIIQEAVVARDSVVLYYGTGRITWKKLSYFTKNCLRYPEVSTKLSKSGSVTAIRNMQAIDELRSIYRAEGPNLSLVFYFARLFRSGLKFNATINKDKVYSLLNLSFQGLTETVS